MTAKRIIGMILVVIGLVGLLWGGLSWTDEKTVVDIGPIEARTRERKTIPIPPLVAGLVLAAGVVLVFVPDRRRA
jgi:drug/metabolite transporter (DMT)-like permease